VFNFEKLEVWQKAIDFGDLIYLETRPFPSDERFRIIYTAAEEQSRMLCGLRRALTTSG
jgi:hypothetical protein